ncbi:MAG: hypothetical protein E6G25_09870 [Actinobacteria bacterium]|nr:MAG: hypothetical protein E6G25_09870 [Actinomycetota bacterium]
MDHLVAGAARPLRRHGGNERADGARGRCRGGRAGRDAPRAAPATRAASLGARRRGARFGRSPALGDPPGVLDPHELARAPPGESPSDSQRLGRSPVRGGRRRSGLSRQPRFAAADRQRQPADDRRRCRPRPRRGAQARPRACARLEDGAVNVWLIGATVLLAALLPCGVVLVRAPILDALVALELVTTLATIALLLLAEGYHRSSYFAVPIVLAFLNVVGALIFVRFLADRRL